MRLFRRSSSGFWGTAAAAALLVATSVLATPWAGLFHMGRLAGLGTVAFTLALAAALLRRWPPARSVVLLASGISVVAATLGGVLAGQPGPLIMAAGAAANLLILTSRPVRRYFEAASNATGDVAPPTPGAVEPPLLPMEKVNLGGTGAATQRGWVESRFRDARSNRSPGERK